jgi:uncharacterized protein
MASTGSASSPAWRSPMAAYVLPLLAFMLVTECVGLVRIENSALPWYRHAPEHWVYPVQCLLIGALLWYYWSFYKLGPWRGLWLGTWMGAIGIALWITPGGLYEWWIRPGSEPPEWWEWFGMVERRDGFDPTLFHDQPLAFAATVAMRFIRMVIIVPLVEELFWRGFLVRYVQAGDKSFTSVPFGRHTWPAYFVTTTAVTLVHHPSDYLAAFAWGSLVYFVAVKTKSLGACVWMHAVGNLLLGLHVMNTQLWGYW